MREINTSGQYGGQPKAQPKRKTYDPETLRIAEVRAETCESCEHFEGITRTRGDFVLYGVKCTQCGCGSRRIIDYPCPIGRHPE